MDATVNKQQLSFGTQLIHAKTGIDGHFGAVGVPIYQVSTFNQQSPDEEVRFDYSRSGNPTREALETTIAQLEGGCAGYAFASGMAAISSVLCLLSSGDQIIVCRDIYGGTYRVLTQLFSRFGIEACFVDTTNLDEIRAAITPATRALFLESPSNPFLNVSDIAGAASIAKEHGIITIVDNTFMTPYLQQPLLLGADIVVHSATKYISGHSDVVGGLVATSSEELAGQIGFIQNAFGAILGPQDAWLLLRGLKTLKVRMDQHQKTAAQIAEWLQTQPHIKNVYYPGLKNHAGHQLAAEQASGFGGIVSFEVESAEVAEHFFKEVKLPAIAVSLGAVESILTYPIRMSHASIPEEKRKELGITDSLIRLSVGLEEPEDLLADLGQALQSYEAAYAEKAYR
ncbi:trans-sulfuration enzyme family protein [Aneurinibacillus tyrosinisolvens]|jgi:cysteine-S-conjugate beta-lyase|uniref:trans-sulfuration enzyme family protein n=1 Tax=Aneurinibacillus tyrosinisolvens TaxID=1443435 RepID=UPI00063F65BB|nr:PLP-dependent aspartate aminotransferase family protein [Aneurinibacillus tyrosinisolvens]